MRFPHRWIQPLFIMFIQLRINVCIYLCSIENIASYVIINNAPGIYESPFPLKGRNRRRRRTSCELQNIYRSIRLVVRYFILYRYLFYIAYVKIFYNVYYILHVPVLFIYILYGAIDICDMSLAILFYIFFLQKSGGII